MKNYSSDSQRGPGGPTTVL